jgi:hypothetical protein
MGLNDESLKEMYATMLLARLLDEQSWILHCRWIPWHNCETPRKLGLDVE